MKMAIIGCGNMGSAFAQRLSATHQLYFYDHNLDKAEKLEMKGYGKACHDAKEAVTEAEIIVLAVKPFNIKETANAVGKILRKGQLVISLLSGTTLETLKGLFPKVHVVRMMPNLALIYGEGVIGLSADSDFSQKARDELTKTFGILGKIYWITEDKFNALTALTGSGPAFFFAMVESMVDAGVAMGFTASGAQDLVYQMLQGSLTLLEKSSKHPGELKWQITSPRGTTIAGLKRLEEAAIRGGIMNTFLAAYDRANEQARD